MIVSRRIQGEVETQPLPEDSDDNDLPLITLYDSNTENSVRSTLFDQICVHFFCPLTQEESRVRELVELNGGTLQHAFDPSVVSVCVGQMISPAIIQRFGETPCVTRDWVTDSIGQGRLLDLDPYLLVQHASPPSLTLSPRPTGKRAPARPAENWDHGTTRVTLRVTMDAGPECTAMAALRSAAASLPADQVAIVPDTVDDSLRQQSAFIQATETHINDITARLQQRLSGEGRAVSARRIPALPQPRPKTITMEFEPTDAWGDATGARGGVGTALAGVEDEIVDRCKGERPACIKVTLHEAARTRHAARCTVPRMPHRSSAHRLHALRGCLREMLTGVTAARPRSITKVTVSIEMHQKSMGRGEMGRVAGAGQAGMMSDVFRDYFRRSGTGGRVR